MSGSAMDWSESFVPPARRTDNDAPSLPEVQISEFAAGLRQTLPVGSFRSTQGSAPLNPTRAISSTVPTWRLVISDAETPGAPPDAIAEALEPLCQHRNALPPLVYPSSTAVTSERALLAWMDEHAEKIEETTYFLVAGDATVLPFSLVHTLGSDKPVGRISLPSLGDYAAYARKVVDAELAAPESASGPVLIFAPDRDQATELSRRLLVDPLVEEVRKRYLERSIQLLCSDLATRSRLMMTLAHPDPAAPSFVIMACHGAEEAVPEAPTQGALIDQYGAYLDAEFARQNQLQLAPNGIVFIWACNGAGTPKARKWKQYVKHYADVRRPSHDFSTHLPQYLLGQSAGPLAIVAHEDLIFAWSLKDLQDSLPTSVRSAGVRPFWNLIRGVLDQTPVGIALQRLRRSIHESEAALALTLSEQRVLLEPTGEDDRRLVLDWMRCHDLRSWTVLGDPAVCLEGVQGKVTLEAVYRDL